MSDLNQQFAKLPNPIRVPGVRIPLSPQRDEAWRSAPGFFSIDPQKLASERVNTEKSPQVEDLQASSLCKGPAASVREARVPRANPPYASRSPTL